MAHAPKIGGFAAWRRGTLCIGIVLMAPMAWADVDQALLEKAEGLVKASEFETAYALLEPWEIAGAGDPVYDYLLGTAALESNRPSKASFVFVLNVIMFPLEANSILDTEIF